MSLQNVPAVEVHSAPIVLAGELREAVAGLVPPEMVLPSEVPVARVAAGHFPFRIASVSFLSLLP